MCEIKVVNNEEKYWYFIRDLRTNDQASKGFIDQVTISNIQQQEYMQKYNDCYFVALYNGNPVGFVGVINGDIRVAVEPIFQNRGVASTLIKFIANKFPDSIAKVKIDNIASLKLFEKCGFKTKFLIMSKDNVENTI